MKKLKSMGICGLIIFFILIGILIVILLSFFLLRNRMTPEETVSRFMYLVENKDYNKAKKLCDTELKHLDLLSNIKPSKLTFDFSEDKKNGKSILLEKDIEETTLNIEMKNTILGWKIHSYDVKTELIEPNKIEERLKHGENISDIQLLYWGESDEATKDEIEEYVKNNTMVALIFCETMKNKNYDKAIEMYKPRLNDVLTIEQLKEYKWDDYKIENNFELLKNVNSMTIKLETNKITISIANGTIMFIIKEN